MFILFGKLLMVVKKSHFQLHAIGDSFCIENVSRITVTFVFVWNYVTLLKCTVGMTHQVVNNNDDAQSTISFYYSATVSFQFIIKLWQW